MPRSPTERISELERLVATMSERLDGTRKTVDAESDRTHRIENSPHELKSTVAVVEGRLAEPKRVVEENSRRRWSVVPSLVGAIIGGTLTFAGQWIIRRYLTR